MSSREGDGAVMRPGQDLQQARRLEVGLIGLRWFVVAFGVLQAILALQVVPDAPGYVVPASFALVAGLAIGNVLVSSFAERASKVEQLRRVGAFAFLLDIIVINGLVITASPSPDSPVWVLAYLLPLEGAVRYQLVGALIPVGVSFVVEPLRDLQILRAAPDHAEHFHAEFVALRVGIQLVVAIVAGLMARSLRRAADEAGHRAWMAEEAATIAEQAAARERDARAELAAFHAAILAGVTADDVEHAIPSMADSVAVDLGLSAFGILLADGPQLVAAGVHGDPGYRLGDRIGPGGEGLARTLADRRGLVPSGPEGPADVVVPFDAGGERIGVLHERAAPDADGGSHLQRLERLADQVALVVQAVRLRARQEETLQRLRELDEMKSDFVAITSHELRTPLSAIRGFVNTMLRRMDQLGPDEMREFLTIVDEQSARLTRLVEDLLVVSRIEAGKLTFAPEVIELAPFLREVALGVGDGRDRVRVTLDPATAPTTTADPHRLQQVLTNLLENALKFSPAAETVELRAEAADGAIRLMIVDRGVGIDPSELEKIFERFHQTDAATTRQAEGAGLGLYITRRLVEAMGGRIRVASKVGAGSTFTVDLPAAPSPSSPVPRSEAARAG